MALPHLVRSIVLLIVEGFLIPVLLMLTVAIGAAFCYLGAGIVSLFRRSRTS